MQEKPVGELGEIFSEVSDVLEAAAAMSDPLKGRSHVIQELEQLRERIKIPASNGRKSDGKWTGFNIEHVCVDCHRDDVIRAHGAVFGLFLLGRLQTLPLPTAKCYMFHWENDNFGSVPC